jgi:uncharacterized coiled-coil protein SlyX
MSDLQRLLQKIRADAAECHLLSNLATDGKQEVFVRVAGHLNALAQEVEKTIATNGAEGLTGATTTAGIEPGHQDRVDHVAFAADRDQAAATDREQAGAASHVRTARSRRSIPWLLVIASAAIAGTLIWVGHREDASVVAAVPSKPQSAPASQDVAIQAMAAALSEQQRERKLLAEQVSALAARVDDLEKARAEAAVLSTKQSPSEDRPAAIEAKPSIPDEKPVRSEEKGNSSPEKPPAENVDSSARQSDGVLPGTGNPAIEPVDPVGTVPVPTRAELEPRKSANGPPGCTHFRSFDPVSGTYMTFSGRRRQCQ